MAVEDDELLAETEALLSEAKESSSAKRTGDQLTLAGMGEAVARISKDADRTHRNIARAVLSVSAAPDEMKRAVESGFQESLKELNQKEKVLALRSAQIDRNGRAWFLATVGCGLAMGLLMLITWLLWFGPGIEEFKAYRDSHSAIERASVFGARIGERDGVTYILFDKGVTTEKCGRPENCVIIKR